MTAPCPHLAHGPAQAVLFDLDQTLVEVQGAWRSGFIVAFTAAAAREPALDAAGEPGAVHDREYRPRVLDLVESGDGDWDSDYVRSAIEAIFAEHGVRDDDLLAATIETYHEEWLNRTTLFDDARRTLLALSGRTRLGLISDGASLEQRAKIARHGLEPLFDVILVSREVGVRKPDPAIFEQALETLQVDADRSLYVGDNPHRDVAGAHAAGLCAVWLNRSGAPYPSDLPPPHHEVATLAAVPRLAGVETDASGK